MLVSALDRLGGEKGAHAHTNVNVTVLTAPCKHEVIFMIISWRGIIIVA